MIAALIIFGADSFVDFGVIETELIPLEDIRQVFSEDDLRLNMTDAVVTIFYDQIYVGIEKTIDLVLAIPSSDDISIDVIRTQFVGLVILLFFLVSIRSVATCV